METSIVTTTNNRELTPALWTMIQEMAPIMHESRLFGVTSVQQAAAIMLKGYELGLGFTASFDLIQVIQGKPSLSPRGALAMLHGDKRISMKITRLIDSKGVFIGYECMMKRENGFEYTGRWTLDEAKKAGLFKPDSGWEKYPENMCLWRAIGFAADVVAPDITAGMTNLMKMPEAFGVALSQEGDVIDLKSSPVSIESRPAEITLDDLTNQFGAEKVLVANDGKIPGTTEEIQAVAAKLMMGV